MCKQELKERVLLLRPKLDLSGSFNLLREKLSNPANNSHLSDLIEL